MLVPQGMAYAMLAGVPPIYGLYAGLIPLFLYALFGTCPQLSIGPVAVSALLVLAGVSQIAEPFSQEYITLVIAAGFFIGIAQIVMSLLRLGFLVSFLSHPVIAGFTSAAALIIIISQLKDILGISIPRFHYPYETFHYALGHLPSCQWITILLFILAFIIILVLKKINKLIPGALLVVILSTFITYIFRLDLQHVDIIKSVPSGFPKIILPEINLYTFSILSKTVFTVTIIGIVESIGIAKAMESKFRDYTIRPNQELFALGISKAIGSFFQAIPSSASFSRTAINSNIGAKSTISSIIAAVFVGFSLFLFTPLFYYLPKAVLAAIIVQAVINLFDIKEARHLWKTHKSDFTMMMVTFVVTLVFGIEVGVLAGVVLSILIVLYKSSNPHITTLGNLPGTTSYRNTDRYQKTERIKNTVIIRFDDQLYFVNTSAFKDCIYKAIEENDDPVYHLVLDGSNIHDIDSSGIHALKEVDENLKERGINLYMCGAIGPVRDQLFISGLMSEPEKHFMNVHDCVSALQGKEIPSQKADAAVQRNV